MFGLTKWNTAFPQNLLPTVIEEMEQTMEKSLGSRIHFPIEIRFVKGDVHAGSVPPRAGTAPTSPWLICIKRCFIKNTSRRWNKFSSATTAPHWGKMHHLGAVSSASFIPAGRASNKFATNSDPDGLFLNPHLRRILGLSAPHQKKTGRSSARFYPFTLLPPAPR